MAQDFKFSKLERELERQSILGIKQGELYERDKKTDLLAYLSHELRTPLNIILLNTDLLLMDNPCQNEKYILENSKRAAQTMIDIINSILEISKIEAHKMIPNNNIFNIKQTVSETINLLMSEASKRHVNVYQEFIGEIPDLLEGDQLRLRQILINLVSNAIKFTEGGKVYVRIEKSDSIKDFIELKVSVADTGMGIPKEKIVDIFTPFFQVDNNSTEGLKGTGLGLSITKAYVNLIGGQIWVESEIGIGSTFYFTGVFQLPANLKRNCYFRGYSNSSESEIIAK